MKAFGLVEVCAVRRIMTSTMKLLNVNSTNGKAEVDVTPLLLLMSITFKRCLTRLTIHKRRYMRNRGIPKTLPSSGDEHHLWQMSPS